MGVANSTYYGFVKVREQSPDAKDWSATDGNFELLSKLLKFFEGAARTGTTPMGYPGFNNTPNPVLATVTEQAAGGVLSPGTTVGIRLAYLNALGLETQGSPEVAYTIAPAGTRPLTPTLNSIQAAAGAIPGGTYIYVMTKRKGSGETGISDVRPVEVPFDSTYSATLGFNAINTYTDGTTALNIYRSAGLNQAFQLVTTITDPAAITFTDTNTIAPQNVNVQPPTVSTFDAQKKIRIDWSTQVIPAGATTLRVYITQQSGSWSTNHLLLEVDLTIVAPATYIDYLGNETLANGWPKESSQIPNNPPKIDLATQSIGAPVLTADMDFAGFQSKNLKLHVTTAPTVADGVIYYDPSVPSVRARINGAWVNWGTTAATAYVHPVEEAGGHIAANIKWASGSGTSVRQVLDRVTNADGTQKQVQVPQKAIGSTAGPFTNSTTPVLLDEMAVTVTPTIVGQWAEVTFSGQFFIDSIYATLTIAIEYEGATIEETIRSATSPGVNANLALATNWATPLGAIGAGKLFRILWWVSAGKGTSVGTRRVLVAKALF